MKRNRGEEKITGNRRENRVRGKVTTVREERGEKERDSEKQQMEKGEWEDR